MRIAIASMREMPPEFRDDELLVEEVGARGAEVDYLPWDDHDYDWATPDLVFARSPWDYTFRHPEFIEWVRAVEAPLENAPRLIEWNADKRYLADLASAGIPVAETKYVEPDGPTPQIEAEVVVKPTISAGGRSTGRFGPDSAEAAHELIDRITASGGTAMVQPFIETVDSDGETAVVTIAGEISHVLRKGAVLRPDEVAPVRADGLGAAEAMYDPELVVAGTAAKDELELAKRVVGVVAERFGHPPLVARVDMLRASDGSPVLLELEAIEPNLYFSHAPGAADRLADALIERARRRSR